MPDITIDTDDLDALIERKIAEREAAARAPRKAVTTGCNCRADGYADRAMHQFGCPYGGQKPRHKDLFG